MGYLGRRSVMEILSVTPAVQEAIARGATAMEIHRVATAAGMRTLRTTAIERVRAGETTLQEVERVIGDTLDDGVGAAPRTPAPLALGKGAPPHVARAPEDAAVQRLLLVEDEPIARKAARKLLFDAGYDVVEAASGEAALDLLRDEADLALMILDLGLPGLQGDEVLRKLKASPATASLPVI